MTIFESLAKAEMAGYSAGIEEMAAYLKRLFGLAAAGGRNLRPESVRRRRYYI
jgi:hypothetical protein